MSLARLTFEHGRPEVPIGLMAALHYLKHAFGLSDEAVVKGWVENPYWQYFCGEEYFQHRLPIDPSQMTRFRTRLEPSGCEKLLELTITAGLATQAVKPTSFRQVTVDTTVQEKASAFPTDGRLYHKGRVWLVRLAKHSRIDLRQSYASQRQASAVHAAALRGGSADAPRAAGT
jgi:transposase, IS5 family